MKIYNQIAKISVLRCLQFKKIGRLVLPPSTTFVRGLPRTFRGHVRGLVPLFWIKRMDGCGGSGL